MIEKLLELFVHAKLGAISGVFLLGASGALVTATTQNGVTTITVTQASPSPSASASPSASPSAGPSASPSASPSPSPSPSPTASASPSASPSPSATPSASSSPRANEACVAAVQAVNAAFHADHTALAKLRGPRRDAKHTLQEADELLKAIRQAAVKALHAGCNGAVDDEDDDDGDGDAASGPKQPEIVFTGSPMVIAQQATVAMDLVRSTMQAELGASPAPSASPRESGRENGKGKGPKNNKD